MMYNYKCCSGGLIIIKLAGTKIAYIHENGEKQKYKLEHKSIRQMAPFIPDEIMLNIIERLAKEDYNNLKPFVQAGKQGVKLALDPSILGVANIEEYLERAEEILPGSTFRPFFERCLHANNKTALTLEALRLAYKENNVEAAISLLRRAGDKDEYAVLACGFLQIANDEKEEGVETLNKVGWRTNVLLASLTSEYLLQAVHRMGPSRNGGSGIIFMEHLPECNCAENDVGGTCVQCFISWNALHWAFLM